MLFEVAHLASAIGTALLFYYSNKVGHQEHDVRTRHFAEALALVLLPNSPEEARSVVLACQVKHRLPESS